MYLPHDVYAELRGLSTARTGLNKRKSALKNTVTAVMDEFFPEYAGVFKCPLSGMASRHILKVCPFPRFILEPGADGVTEEIRKAVKKTAGRKKAVQPVKTAKDSTGADYGEDAARLKLEELELLEKQAAEPEGQMASAQEKTDYAEFLLCIKGTGIVTPAACPKGAGRPGKV